MIRRVRTAGIQIDLVVADGAMAMVAFSDRVGAPAPDLHAADGGSLAVWSAAECGERDTRAVTAASVGALSAARWRSPTAPRVATGDLAQRPHRPWPRSLSPSVSRPSVVASPPAPRRRVLLCQLPTAPLPPPPRPYFVSNLSVMTSLRALVRRPTSDGHRAADQELKTELGSFSSRALVPGCSITWSSRRSPMPFSRTHVPLAGPCLRCRRSARSCRRSLCNSGSSADLST